MDAVSSLREILGKHGFTVCEAKKYAFRQNKSGVVVSFLIHPNEVDSGLATEEIGARVLFAIVKINDDETVSPHGSKAEALPSTVAEGDAPDERESGIEETLAEMPDCCRRL